MLAILRRELTTYFRNPIGPILIGAYALLSGICFTLSVVMSLQSYMGTYFGLWLYFVNVILVTLLSFRFFSEEKKNKTDQLLLTAPVSLYSIVLGKFLSASVIYSAATLINILYGFIVSAFGKLDIGGFIMQMIGSLLIGYCMIAVALFISTMTDSQIGTVCATFATLIIMYIIDTLATLLPSGVDVLVKSVSLYSRYNDFAVGLLSIAPIVFYISVTALCLFLSVRMIEKRRWA